MYCHPMLAWEDVTCHLFVSHLSPFRFEAMSHSGEIIFMAMGAEEEYQWRRQGRQSLRLLSTETFCWTYTVTFHWWFSGFNWSFSYFLSNWLVQSWGGDVFPNCLRLGTRHHGRCPQHQIPGLCSSVFGCDLPLSSHFLSWAELTWTDLNWIGLILIWAAKNWIKKLVGWIGFIPDSIRFGALQAATLRELCEGASRLWNMRREKFFAFSCSILNEFCILTFLLHVVRSTGWRNLLLFI